MADRYARIIKYATQTPWLIRKENLMVIQELLRFRARGGRLTEEEIQARIGADVAKPKTTRAGAVAVLPVFGVIAHRMDQFMAMSGGTSTERLAADFRAMLADDSVGAIMLEFDTPGGTVDGVPELAAEIFKARGQKPIIAHVNTMAASAGYFLASQADEIVMSPSSEVGSIGVYAMHEDWSKALDEEGVKVTFITAGEGKVAGNPYEPLSEDARADIQKRVDEVYGDFVAAVSKGREVAKSDITKVWQAKMYGAKEAVKLGMADRVGTLEDTIARLMGKSRGRSAAAASVDPPALTLAAEAPIDPAITAVADATGPVVEVSVAAVEDDEASRRRLLLEESY